jgi:rhodanese-related sulfurtransferase
MFQSAQRALLIVALGSLIGLLSNGVSSKGIPLITPPKKAPKAEEFVPVAKAHDLWGAGGAFFLDARKPLDFEAGHIANALNLPVEEFGEYYPKLAPMLSPDSAIVVYCDGTECELSHRLADQLRQQGYTNVHMLFNGWTAWRSAGYPVEQGVK